MAAINSSFPSILDVLKLKNPDGSMARVVDLLSMTRGLVPEAVFLEGNLDTGHRVTTRTGLPSPTWRRLNEGINAGKVRNDQFDEACGMMESKHEIDVDLPEMAGSAGLAYRAEQDDAHQAAMMNEAESAAFYASQATAPERITGLAPRYDNAAKAGAGSQIIKLDAAASGADQTSIWLVKWGRGATFMMYPKGTKGGIERIDMGMQNINDGTGKSFIGYQTNFKWRLGLVVEDYRSVVRICNIDWTNLSKTGENLIQAIIDAYYTVNRKTPGRYAFYCNRQILSFLHHQARNGAKNGTLGVGKDAFGEEVTMAMGIPFRETDAILNTEAVVP
jgi:hypothetical protein